MKKHQGVLALAFGLVVTGVATAQSSESLLKKLVEKGVLTEAEAGELRKEAKGVNSIRPKSWIEIGRAHV